MSFWSRDDYKGNISDLTTISDESANVLGFLEHQDGTLFTPTEIREVRKHAYQAFQTLLLEGIAPLTWSQADSKASNFFRKEILTCSPAIGLCESNWKVDTLASLVYGQW
ncbi:hypothetical protein R3P38DRAFT_2580109, partial [Favolaschia claudopus]